MSPVCYMMHEVKGCFIIILTPKEGQNLDETSLNLGLYSCSICSQDLKGPGHISPTSHPHGCVLFLRGMPEGRKRPWGFSENPLFLRSVKHGY